MGGNAPAVGMDEPRPRIRRQGGAAWGNVSPYAMGGANWGIMDDGLDGGCPADGWGPVSLSTKPGSSGSLPRAMGGAASGVSEVRATSEFAPCDGGP